MPFLKNGNARDYVHNHPECDRILIVCHINSEADCLKYLLARQLHHVSLGLVYLHHNNVMHGDLKAVGFFSTSASGLHLIGFQA